MAERWYVVQTLPRMESWAVENIVKTGLQAYWPRYKTEVRGKITADKYRSVFPSYIFANFDVVEDPWRGICSARGVRKILGAREDGATALPRGFVEMMMTDSPNGVIERPSEAGMVFNVGDAVRITDGPLAGHVGVMKFHEKGRVALLLSLLGRENIVYLPMDRVAYAGAPL